MSFLIEDKVKIEDNIGCDNCKCSSSHLLFCVALNVNDNLMSAKSIIIAA